MWIPILIAILILGTIPAIIFKKKLGIEVHGPLCLWKTKKTLGIIEKLSKRKKIWTVLADLGIVFSFGLLGAGFIILDERKDTKKAILYYLLFAVSSFFLIVLPAVIEGTIITTIVTLIFGLGGFALLALLQQAITILTNLMAGQPAMPGVAPVIPGVDVPGSPLSVPLYAVIGLILLLVIHEWGHGIVARAEKIAVKSVGLVTLGILPIGAFTEPDEDELEKTTRRKRSRVYSIGSMVNLVAAFAFAVLLLLPLSIFVSPGLHEEAMDNIKHLEVTEVSETSSVKGLIEPGDKIYNARELFEAKPDQEITLNTSVGIIGAQTNEFGQIGVSVEQKNKGALSTWFWTKQYTIGIITWIVLLNFLVGVINYLPFAIFDGARLIKDITGSYAEKTRLNSDKFGKGVSISLSLVVTALLIINALPYFF